MNPLLKTSQKRLGFSKMIHNTPCGISVKYRIAIAVSAYFAFFTGCKHESSHPKPRVGAIVFAPWIRDDSTILYLDDTNEISKFNKSWTFVDGFDGTMQCGYDYELKRIDSTYKATEFALINMRCSAITTDGFVYRNQMTHISEALQNAKHGIMKFDTIRGDVNSWINELSVNPNFIGVEIIDKSPLYQFCYDNNQYGNAMAKVLGLSNSYQPFWSEPETNKRVFESNKYPVCISESFALKTSLDSAKIPHKNHQVGIRALAFFGKSQRSD